MGQVGKAGHQDVWVHTRALRRHSVKLQTGRSGHVTYHSRQTIHQATGTDIVQLPPEGNLRGFWKLQDSE